MSDLDDAAEDAKYQLAWCVPVVLYLHSIKECADKTAALIKEHPENYKSKSDLNRPGPPVWAEKTLARAIAIIENAEKNAEGGSRYEPEHKPGGYLNKASAVYIMSLVDWFVDKAHALCCPGCEISGFRERLKCLNKKFGDPSFFDSEQTKRVRYLALVRNMIVHQRAKTDSESIQKLRQLNHVWPTMPLKEFDQEYAVPEKKLVLDIAKIILPGIRYCFDFLDYAMKRAKDYLGC